MPTEEAKQLEELGLAPPPSFGVADRTDKHMLPVATAMEDILNEDIDELAALGTDSGALPSEAIESLESLESLEPVPAGSVPAPEAPPSVESVPSVDHTPEPAGNSGGRRLAIVGLVLSAAALGLWLFVDRGDEAPGSAETAPAQTDTIAKAGQPAGLANDSPAAEAGADEDGSDSKLDSQVDRANNIAEMKATSYTARHALLETLERQGATGRVDLDLHIALDLMQADQSTSPCATFADALTLIEADPDRPSVKPALASVHTVPSPGRREASDACDGLQQRLDALTAPAAEAEPAASTTKSSKSKRKRPTKRGAAKSPKPSTPAAAPPPAAEPKSEPTPKKPKPNVISKLDDDLRE